MTQETNVNINHKDMLHMTAQVVTAYVGNNNINGSKPRPEPMMRISGRYCKELTDM